ncbi:hypothetical protein NKR23_g12462 [Pleurostoma richardsiae]|uniref:PD-(D/E)XK nuclease-like domain-containing protein n=1 Tax=Pleurostoma richardsiae TaxID=41990 RepID=A0AA38R7T7_9PEZI|nr:hypothetical protein NKR23_g12462 [Pleurostoma richardsiae]
MTSTATGGSRRSRSPAKSIADLSYARVEMRSLQSISPPDLQQLSSLGMAFQDIVAASWGHKVVPEAVRDDLSAGSISDALWDANVADAYHLPDEAARAELAQVRDIVQSAIECHIESQSVAAWNTLVHYPILSLALGGHAVQPWVSARSSCRHRPEQLRIHSRVSTSASIIPALVPRNSVTGEAVTGSIVDFNIAIQPTPSHEADIRVILGGQPGMAMRSVNQTMYPPLQFRLVAIAVETKTELAPETGEGQLAVWTSAWLRRRLPLSASASAVLSAPPPVPLGAPCTKTTFSLSAPLTHRRALVVPHRRLSEIRNGSGLKTATTLPAASSRYAGIPAASAEDVEPKLVIFTDHLIGDTRSALGVYEIPSALRHLATWADGPFREWHENVMATAVSAHQQPFT